MSYFPYGEERTSTADGREKFGTYTRDGFGQDYAEQRYYNANTGAFWTPDPGGIKTAKPTNPSSWNRYAYAKGYPIGRVDRHGREDCDPDANDACFSTTVSASGDDDGGDDDDSDDDTYDPTDPVQFANCVQGAITAAANQALQSVGVNLSQLGGTMTMQIAGEPNPAGGTYTETELNITGIDVGTLINAMCNSGFYNNGTSTAPQCPGNTGATWEVGKPHKYPGGGRYSGNFRSPGWQHSVQVNTTLQNGGAAQIDVDPFNPAAGLVGMLGHFFFQVLPNTLTGGDSTYGCN
jgi:RHS repeat-associated protein